MKMIDLLWWQYSTRLLDSNELKNYCEILIVRVESEYYRLTRLFCSCLWYLSNSSSSFLACNIKNLLSVHCIDGCTDRIETWKKIKNINKRTVSLIFMVIPSISCIMYSHPIYLSNLFYTSKMSSESNINLLFVKHICWQIAEVYSYF